MASLGKLVVTLAANTASFDAGLNKAQQQAKEAAVGIDRAVSGIGKSFAKIGIGAGVAVAAITKIVDTTDNMAKAAKAANLTAEAFQEITFAGERMGVAQRQTEEGLRRLNRRFGEFVNSGAGPAAKAFETLGIEAKTADGKVKGTGQVFDEIVRKLEGVETQSQKAAIASQLFGDDAGPKLALLLQAGASGVAALREEKRRLGIVSNAQAAQAEATADAITNMKASFVNTFQVLALQFAPAMQRTAELMVGMAPHVTTLIVLFGTLAGAKAIAGLVIGFTNLAKAIAAVRIGMIALTTKSGPFVLLAALAASAVVELARVTGIMDKLLGKTNDLTNAQRNLNLQLSFAENISDAQKLEDAKTNLEATSNELIRLERHLKVANRRWGENHQNTKLAASMLGEAEAKHKKLTEEVKKLEKHLSLVVPKIETVAGGAKDLGISAGEAKDQVELLIDGLSSWDRQLDVVAEAMRRVENRFQNGQIGLSEYLATMTGLDEKLADLNGKFEETGKGLEKVAEEGEKSAERVQSAWEKLLDYLPNGLRQVANILTSQFDQIGSALDGLISKYPEIGAAIGGFGTGAAVGSLAGGDPLASGIGGAIGGAIGSIWGPVGSAIGSLIGGLADSVFGSDDTPRFQVFSGYPGIDQIPSFRRGDARETPFGVVALEGVKNIENGAVQQFLDSIAQFDRSVAGALSTLGEGAVEAAANALRSGNYRESFEGEVTLDQVLTQRLGEIVTSLEPRLRSLVEPLASQGVEQGLNGLSAAINLVNAIDANPLERYAEAVRLSGLSLNEARREESQAIIDQIRGFDGSIESMQQITAGIQSFDNAIIQTLATIDNVSAGVGRLAESGVFGIEQQVARARDQLAGTNANLFEFNRTRANQLIGGLGDQTSIDAINRQSQSAANLLNQAFGLLSPEQQIRRQTEFVNAYQDIERNAQTALDRQREETERIAQEESERRKQELDKQQQITDQQSQNVVQFGDWVGELGGYIERFGGSVSAFPQFVNVSVNGDYDNNR